MGASQGYTGPVSLAPIEGIQQGYFLMDKWQGGRSAAYWDALLEHSKNRAAVLSVMGNQHFGSFTLARAPLFDFVDPSEPGHPLYPDAIVVPRRMVKALPEFSTVPVREIIRKLQAGGCRQVILMGTPPVREDFGRAEEDVRKSIFWREQAMRMGIDIAKCTFTPAPIMKRLWGVLQETLADVARETGTSFLPVLKESIDLHGYLAAEYRGPIVNFTHANDTYGRRMLAHVVNSVSKGQEQRSAQSMPVR
jgi:hypothetical protein